MEFGRCVVLLCSALASAICAEARSLQLISPSLEPKSSKKFFHKDYPNDKRPGVDKLHFNHPYPVIQDSGEFDRDYVKDENSDNGHWEAQQEYDRLRHKLKKEKKEAAKALEKRREEEGELKEAAKKYEEKVKDKEDAMKKLDEHAQQKVGEDDAHPEEDEKKGETSSWSWNWNWWPFSWPKWPTSEPAPEAVDESSGVRGATKDTEKARDNLKDCKKELEKARSDLEKVMEEAKRAKAKQSEADAAVERAAQKQLEAEKLSHGLHDKVKGEEAEHAAAEAVYLKEKARVDKLKGELDAATAKVKALRNGEDKGGGVYNTPTKSLTVSMCSPCVAVFVLMVTTSWRLV